MENACSLFMQSISYPVLAYNELFYYWQVALNSPPPSIWLMCIFRIYGTQKSQSNYANEINTGKLLNVKMSFHFIGIFFFIFVVSH